MLHDVLISFLQAFGVFGLCQIHAFIDYLRSKLSQSHFDLLFRTLAITVAVAAIVVGGTLTFLGSICTNVFTYCTCLLVAQLYMLDMPLHVGLEV